MKVLFITNWYPTRDFSYGGVFVREHAKAVRAAGNEVVVLHLARASKACRGLWKMEEIRVAGRPGERINEYIRSLGQDDQGEQYVLTSDVIGPTGDTGKVYKMVPPAK